MSDSLPGLLEGLRSGETVETVGDSTVYGQEGLPPELQHERILAYRDMSSSLGEGYQIIFEDSWMPFDYYTRRSGIADKWVMHYARLERHHDPKTNWFIRRFLARAPERICIVLTEVSD